MDSTKCIFCGRTGADMKITREHTFSNWINEVLPAAAVGADITYQRSIQHGPKAGTVNTWPAKVVADHTIRGVCTDCNSGWMKRSEDAVAPLIEPMIKGQPAQLTVAQQLTVATWAAMKAAVFEYAWSEDTVLTAADREVIMTRDRPPASVQVRLAAIESDGSPLRARGVGYVDNSTGGKIICLVLTIGCLVAQVFGGPGAGTHGLRTSSAPRTDRIRIFPPTTNMVRWPPPVALNDQTLPAFANPLAPVATPGRHTVGAVEDQPHSAVTATTALRWIGWPRRGPRCPDSSFWRGTVRGTARLESQRSQCCPCHSRPSDLWLSDSMPWSSRIYPGFVRCAFPLPGGWLRFSGCGGDHLMKFAPDGAQGGSWPSSTGGNAAGPVPQQHRGGPVPGGHPKR